MWLYGTVYLDFDRGWQCGIFFLTAGSFFQTTHLSSPHFARFVSDRACLFSDPALSVI